MCLLVQALCIVAKIRNCLYYDKPNLAWFMLLLPRCSHARLTISAIYSMQSRVNIMCQTRVYAHATCM